MRDVLQAEWLKVRHNLPVTLFTIGTLAMLVFVLLNMLAILGALGLWQSGIEELNWHEQLMLALLFVNQLLSQGLFITFAAVSFGGEYRWNTWKNILPRARRYQVVLSKFIMIMLAVLIATQAMALATLVGSLEVALLLDVPFFAAPWNDSGIPFAQQYLWISITLFCNFTIAALYASIAAIATRSTSAGIILGLLISFADTLSQPVFNALSGLLRIDALGDIPYFLPNYNNQNIMLWITTGAPFEGWSFWYSPVILVGWIIISALLAIGLFARQDIE